jgi:hypothetical protein
VPDREALTHQSARDTIVSRLDAAQPERVMIVPGNNDWLITVHSLGKSQVVAVCPYNGYAVAVGVALASVLDVPVEQFDG